ncbi:MAG: aminoacetone oxidase family FAD-binding enzyme [Chloroflexi bacterium]|nr:aminoacetone oxidase family FAD-binding enzyme [Chloroflexota bacterium]
MIAVIGAGASGIAAALQAAWNGAPVTLFERNEAIGRKLLVTGSGRCNITNDAASAEKYTCADPAWMESLLGCFGVKDLLSMLARIGILVHKTDDGWYYPLSDSAHSVVEAFSSALAQAGVNLVQPAEVRSFGMKGKRFTVRYLQDGQEQERKFDQVIVSAGGPAYPSLGSRGELFPVLKRMGHTVLPLRPALAPVLAELGDLRPLQGVRLNAGVTLWNGSRRLTSTRGNLIFTQWGLNGPAVMDASHHITAHPGAAVELSLNLLAYFQTEFDRLLAQNRKSLMPLRVFLGAFFPPKVVSVYLKNARLPEDLPLSRVSDESLELLIKKLKDTRLPVKGVRDFEYCQMSVGGVPVSEVNPHTLESRVVSGLFLTGETVDVIGPCGGYNLTFAFISGALAGRAAARQRMGETTSRKSPERQLEPQ